MSKISLIQSNQSYQGTINVLKPLQVDLKNKLENLDSLVIKINFVTTENELATTPFQSVKAFIDFVKEFFKGKVIISEEASLGNTEDGFEKYGFRKLADSDPQIEIFNSARSASEKVIIKHPQGKLNLNLAQIYTRAPFLVSICRPKIHDTVITTLGIKNVLVGAIQGALTERQHIHQGMAIHWIMKEIARHVFPDFVIINGVVGMERNGPCHGTAKKAGWLIASQDALAADSLATYFMGFNIKDVGYLNLLHQAGFGELYPKSKIDIIGPNPKKLITPFKPHQSFTRQIHWQ